MNCEFSPCRNYRYTLWRDWRGQYVEQVVNGLFDPYPEFYPGTKDDYVQFIGLNPSIADDTKDDPTIRRCIAFAKSWGFGRMVMTNLFAFRATNPRDMEIQDDPVGPDNDAWLDRCASAAGMIVAAWGKRGAYRDRAATVMNSIGNLRAHRLNADGSPEHPIYVPKIIMPELFPPQSNQQTKTHNETKSKSR